MDVIYLKGLLFVCGTVALILGAIGIFVPVLPTTPFLLLSAFCYIRSSKRMYEWLVGNKVFGKYIYNYLHYRAIEKRAKISALVFLWVTLLISIYLIDNNHVRVLLMVIGIGVSVHIGRIKTLKKDEDIEE